MGGRPQAQLWESEKRSFFIATAEVSRQAKARIY